VTAQPLKSPRKPKGSGHLRRSEILKAAQEIFAEVGYEGATVRRIAEKVGVSSTAIYLHFPDKRAMLLEIAIKTMGPILTDAKAIAGNKSIDPRERCRLMMFAYMKQGVDHPRSYAVMIDDAQREMAQAEGPAHDLMAKYHRNFLSVVEELAVQKRLRGRSAKAVAQTIWAGCHGMLTLVQGSPYLHWEPNEALHEAMIDGLLDGLID
jgi:AcrR family transcriptional regulator